MSTEPAEIDVGLFVDGPNVLREEFDVDFDDLRAVISDRGRVSCLRVYLDADAPSNLVRAAEAHGFETIVTSGDVDVRLAVEATEFAATRSTGLLAIASRDIDFKPVFELAGRHGISTLAITPGDHGRSAGFVAAADEVISLGPTE